MSLQKRWILADASPQVDQLASRLKTSPAVAQILINRGMFEPQDCREFLAPTLKQLPDPATLPGLTRAADRIARAIRDKQRIVIYGDYDVDGITATAILWHAIRVLGHTADYYVPHRLEEGYGLKADALAALCDQKYDLIITVDCGITAVNEAKIAKDRGVDLIITDHHDWKGQNAHVPGVPGQPDLPICYEIVHPRLPGAATPYANPALCGAGVAFKLAWGLGKAATQQQRVSEEFRHFLIDATAFAALGTIADVVPLRGENRALASFGLGGLKQSKLIGIKALIETAGLTGQKLDSYHVGFQLAPRLNASGRMGHAREAIEMLTTADTARATEIATYLEAQNKHRQATEKDISAKALEQAIANGYDSEDCRAIVLWGDDWHPGVIGIVASRMVNKFNRPALMIAINDGHGQGSGRSIPGFHLAKALDSCREHLIGCGGHEMAAGLTVQAGKLHDFREAFEAYAELNVAEDILQPRLYLDCETEIRNVNLPMVEDFAKLGPFGHGNARPVIYCRSVELTTEPRRVGQTGQHLQLLVRQSGQVMKAIAFNFGSLFEQLKPGIHLDLAVEPTINDYNGRRTVELDVKDIRVVTRERS